MSGKLDFQHRVFLEKEAFFPKGVNPSILSILTRKLRNKNAPKGKEINRPEDATVNPENVRFYDRDETADHYRKDLREESTGGFLSDGTLGAIKFIFPKTKEKIQNTLGEFKELGEALDGWAGRKLGGDNIDSFRGKVFSKKTNRKVGEETSEADGKSDILKAGKQFSAFAPVEKTVKFTSPFLAAGYVTDKLYPKEDQIEPEVTHQYNGEKTAAVQNHLDFMDSHELYSMDKKASLQKIAELEEGLTKYAQQIEMLSMEKRAAEQMLTKTIQEKRSIEKTAAETHQKLMEKEAVYEELRLRTIAQKRSKIAVDLADSMLDAGLIKQAELQETVDELMVCDERTIKKYENMTKMAKKQEESLESLEILGEYKNNRKLATTAESVSLGLSKRGQTIGDAASDLIK